MTQRDIQHFPLLNRDMVDLIQTAPEANGTSVAGANNRYNNILIDGGTDNDFFGLSRGTGTPGGQIGARSIPWMPCRSSRSTCRHTTRASAISPVAASMP